MKTRKLLAFLLLLSLLFTCMPAQAADKVQVLHAYASESSPVMYAALRPVSTGSVPASVKNSAFKFFAEDGEELPVLENNLPAGHIVVVDRSEYYSRHITANHVAQIVKTYLQLLPQDDVVKFIFADTPGQGTQYMTVSAAINYMNTLTAFSTNSPLLSTAITNAFVEAASEVEGDPVCKTVAVVANPNNAAQAGQFTFGNVATAAISHFTVMVPTRARYEDNKNTGFANYKAGRANLNQLATQMGGSYFEIPETGDVTASGNESYTSVDTSGISAASAYLNSVRSFAIDISHLAELFHNEKGVESFRITVKVQDEIVGTIEVDVDRSVMPTPALTPVPTFAGTPSPTPIPIVVAWGDSSLKFRNAMFTLISKNYLPANYLEDASNDEKKSYDNQAQTAYEEFCRLNGIEITEGISEEGYEMLTDSEAKTRIIPKTTATVVPTATPSPTPIPTVPQHALRMGDSDQDLPSNYIQAIQARLQELNCYMTENGPMSYTPGIFDQSTMDAVNAYCKAFNVTNTTQYGASKELCLDILTVKRAPIATPAPTAAPTATPAPTIPAAGYQLGNTDADIPGGFIQAIQTRLQALNCYATAEGMLTFTPGVFDDATMQAVNAYCENYNVNNTVVNGVSATLCQDILNTDRVPRETPTVSLMEKVKEFLMRPLFAIGTFQVIMWMALVLCVVLVVGIIIVIVMMRSNDDAELSKSSERMSRTPAKDQNPDEYNQLVTRPEVSFDSDKTMPEGVGSTVPEGFGMPVSLRIEYLDKVRNESPIITSAYTMGRRDCALLLDSSDRSCSSKHAMLYAENGQLFVRDLDSTNGTFVNGNRISKANDPQSALSDKTMILDEQDPQDQGYMLNRGDVIRMGKHRVTVQW